MSAAVSIVVPVHGAAQLTARCLDMVLSELPADCEVVVVDDASPDETPALLAGYGEAIRTLRLEENVGFARACNAGAEAAHGELLVFLNNDIEPLPGWLAALREYAAGHPEAVAVGAKLLYPNGTVQHAGVVFGQDGYPHHLYAGFPADHPAVNRARRLQAVTGACLLVRRAAFEAAGGFDPGFLNSLEDVDLCLRLAEAGGEVHYCPQAALVHLESASRGREERFERSVALYRERWRERVRRDDLEVYLADDLLSLEYHETYPARISVDPLLAVVAGEREEEIELLLEGYARQSAGLLQEAVRLTAALPEGAPAVAEGANGDGPAHGGDGFDRERFLARVRRLEEEVRQLQLEAAPVSGVEPSTRLGYADLVRRVREAVEREVPAGARVLVLSRGDRELVRLGDRQGEHFPQDEAGNYAGHHPADSDEAIAALERLREEGARFLAVPSPSAWWLEHYDGFARHLGRYPLLGGEDCEIYDLRLTVSAGPLERVPGSRVQGDIEALPDERGLTVYGWAFAKNRQAVAVELVDEAGRVLGEAPIGLERPDVVHGVGEVPGALRSGFMLRLAPRRPGREQLTLRVVCEGGEAEDLGAFAVAAGAADGPSAEDGPGWTCSCESPDRDRVVVGQEGWLFLTEDSNDALGQHTGQVRFSPEDKEALAELLRERRAAVESRDALWLTAVVPDKEAVYAEFLPPQVVPVEHRPVHDFLEIADSVGAPAIYLLDDLRAAKGEGDLYMRTDTHWNHRGAFVAYRAVCRELALRGLDLEVLDPRSIGWIEQPVQGDLGSKLYPEIAEGKDVFPVLDGEVRGVLAYDNRVRNHGMVQVQEQPDRVDLPTCLVFGESFAPLLVNFLKESFGRVTFVHTSMLVAELVERLRPDVVLSVPTERFLISVPDDAEALAKLAETAIAKGGELPWPTSADPNTMPA
ncbi:MAG TPA: glycosyltransferase [Solirubrobacterales bacterium]|nr:glycosyltransferase [Solirubrobacterales bacterium]